MSQFQIETSVEKVSDNVWRGQLHRGWRIGRVPNGGYVLAIGARALSEALPHPHPQVINAFYLSPTVLGPIYCHVETLRSSKRTTHAVVKMLQEDEVKVQITAAYVDVNNMTGPSWTDLAPVEIPPWDECEDAGNTQLEFRQRVDIRLTSSGRVFEGSDPSGDARFDGWLAHKDGTDPDILSLIMFADALPPPPFNVFGLAGWVPTVELTVQVRGIPCPGPIRGTLATHAVTEGLLEEDGYYWDSRGKLVALSRQTARVRVK
tara:strand:+ start:1049 stop:1834 length:786 start_codon:yes stop_codon:yes gene_type:complete